MIKTESTSVARPGDDSIDTVAKSKRDIQRKVLAHAVQGDILVKTADHVVIIQNLNYSITSDVITDFSQVDVIHSCEKLTTENNSTWQVQKSTANQVSSSINVYQLRRLTVKEN